MHVISVLFTLDAIVTPYIKHEVILDLQNEKKVISTLLKKREENRT